MSYTSIEIVKEFFWINGFFVLQKEDVIFVKNLTFREKNNLEDKFLIEKEDIPSIKNGVIKPVGWHTMKFTPSVLKNSPEIFHFLKPSFLNEIKKFFKEENFFKILVIPGLPSSENLKKESISFMKEKGIEHVIKFPTIISGLIEKINSRQVYHSATNELLRILKFYQFFSEKQPPLPFKKKIIIKHGIKFSNTTFPNSYSR